MKMRDSLGLLLHCQAPVWRSFYLMSEIDRNSISFWFGTKKWCGYLHYIILNLFPESNVYYCSVTVLAPYPPFRRYAIPNSEGRVRVRVRVGVRVRVMVRFSSAIRNGRPESRWPRIDIVSFWTPKSILLLTFLYLRSAVMCLCRCSCQFMS